MVHDLPVWFLVVLLVCFVFAVNQKESDGMVYTGVVGIVFLLLYILFG